MAEEKKIKKAGRPAFKVSDDKREIVKNMSAYGMPQEHIAASLGISIDTLFKYFEEELKSGKADINMKVAQCLVDKAVGGNVGAMIFWLKTQAGFKETTRVESEVSGKDGGPISINEIQEVSETLLAGIKSKFEK